MRLIKFFGVYRIGSFLLFLPFFLQISASNKPGLADMMKSPGEQAPEVLLPDSAVPKENKVSGPEPGKLPTGTQLPAPTPADSPETSMVDPFKDRQIAESAENARDKKIQQPQEPINEPNSVKQGGIDAPGEIRGIHEKDTDSFSEGSKNVQPNIKEQVHDKSAEDIKKGVEKNQGSLDSIAEQDKIDHSHPPVSFEDADERSRAEFAQRDMENEFNKPMESVGSEGGADQAEVMIESALNSIETADEGNWLLKRIWWEQAQDLFEKIITLNDQIVQLQMSLVTSRGDFDKHINNMFIKTGLEQADIESLLTYLLGLQSKEESAENIEEKEDKIKEEIDILDKIDSKKEELENLKKNLQEISTKDNLISESLIQLMHLVNECRQYERKSWNDFKEIGQVLNDEKAKTLYYQIEANYKNINSVHTYMSGELSEYIHKNLDSIEKLASQITSTLTQLDEQDLNIKSLTDAHKSALEKKKEIKESKEQEAKKPKKKPTKGFFAKMGNWFGILWKKVKGLFGFK